MTGDQELSEAEIEAFEREDALEDPWVSADQYPRLGNVSAGFMYRAVIRALEPSPPEYVTVSLPDGWHQSSVELAVAVAQWNMLWEAAQFRRRFFSEEQLPPQMREVADRGDVNVVFVPRTASRYYEYAPLFHLLPRSTVKRHGLPLLRGGQWPYLAEGSWVGRYIPADFETRLERAWAQAVWRHLVSGSPLRAFSRSDPIRLLAHNLDFWLPPVTAVIQEILQDLPVVDKGVTEGPPPLTDGTVLEGAVMANPRMGTDLWRGEAMAAEVLRWTVEEADANGQLRGILTLCVPTASKMISPSTGHLRGRTSSASCTTNARRSRFGSSNSPTPSPCKDQRPKLKPTWCSPISSPFSINESGKWLFFCKAASRRWATSPASSDIRTTARSLSGWHGSVRRRRSTSISCSPP
jgi:hypothetical protein